MMLISKFLFFYTLTSSLYGNAMAVCSRKPHPSTSDQKIQQCDDQRDKHNRFRSLPSDYATICANHQINFDTLFLSDGEEMVDKLETDEAMHEINMPWLSTLMGKYFCDKLALKSDHTEQEKEKRVAEDQAEEVKIKRMAEDQDEKLDFETEKHVWTPTGPRKFAVRAEKMIKLINNKYGIRDEDLLMSLSALQPLIGRGGSGGVFYQTTDNKFIVKNLSELHHERAAMDNLLDKYAEYVLKMGTDQTMINRIHLIFQLNVFAKVRDNNRNMVIRQMHYHFVVLNNAFYGIDHKQLLKFDLKGTFSSDSAIQLEQQKAKWDKPKGRELSIYREYDFLGIARDQQVLEPFFKEGILLADVQYQQLATAIKNDVAYFATNKLDDYSLLLGVHFLDQGEDNNDSKNSYKNKNGGNFCVPAICHNCKRGPEAEYKPLHHLCLYMAIVDIMTESNKTTQAYFMRMYKTISSEKEEFANMESMAEFNGFHLEIVTPIPALEYKGRFLGTMLGCIFHPASSSSSNAADVSIIDFGPQQLIGLRQSICHAFGEKRENFVKKLDEMCNNNHRFLETNCPWYEHEDFQYSAEQFGVVVYGMELFKEMMDKWAMPSWDLLTSLSESLIGAPPASSQSADGKRVTVDNNFQIKKISKKMLPIFGNYFKHIYADGGDKTLLPRFFALFSHKKEYFVVQRNAFSLLKTDGDFLMFPWDRNYEFDFNWGQKRFVFDVNSYREMVNQIEEDAKFLRDKNLMGYALLVGTRYELDLKKQFQVTERIAMELSINREGDFLNVQQEGENTKVNAYYYKFMCYMAVHVLETVAEVVQEYEHKFCPTYLSLVKQLRQLGLSAR